MPLDQAEANRLLEASLGKATYAAPTTPMMARLMSANGTASANGTEIANAGGSAYAPQNFTTATPTGGTNGTIANNAAVTYTNMPAATSVGVEFWSSGTPRREYYGALTTNKVTALGDSLTFAAAALSIGLA